MAGGVSSISALLAAVGILALCAGPAHAQSSYAHPNAGDVPDPYQPFVSYGLLPDDRRWGATSGISVAPDGNLWAADRCGANSCAGSDLDPIVELDRNTGRVLRHFGKGLLVFPHGLTVDAHGNVWVTDGLGKDGKGQQVLEFSPDGRLLLTP